MSFEDIWAGIEKDKLHETAAGIIRRRILPEACCDLFLGVEKPSSRRIFLLRVASSSVPDVAMLPQGRGFEVRLLTLPDDPNGYSSVLLAQTNPVFRDIFTTLATDVAEHVSSAEDQKTAVETFLARLKRWQQFLERSGPDGLGEEAQRGLFGELWFMRNHLIPTLGPSAVTAWTGPSMTAQDFQLTGLGVEVKVTTAKQHQKLIIAGEKQLEISPEFRVFVFHLSLNPLRDTGISLVELVSQLRVLLANNQNALVAFEDALLAAGYLDAHASRYSQPGYLKREQHFFEVRDGFPRIIGSDLRDGVGDVAYSISVAACVPFVVSETDFLKTLGNCKI